VKLLLMDKSLSSHLVHKQNKKMVGWYNFEQN
jgi:hypothetical protein